MNISLCYFRIVVTQCRVIGPKWKKKTNRFEPTDLTLVFNIYIQVKVLTLPLMPRQRMKIVRLHRSIIVLIGIIFVDKTDDQQNLEWQSLDISRD